MAREPERIEVVLDKIREVWYNYPEFRLMQLLENVDGSEGEDVMEDPLSGDALAAAEKVRKMRGRNGPQGDSS